MSVYVLGSASSVAPGGSTGDAPAPVQSWSGASITSAYGTVRFGADIDILLELQGLGPAPRTVQLTTALGMPGAVPVRQRPVVSTERRITGPLHIRGASALERAALQSELLRVLAPADDSPVTFSIIRGDEVVSTVGYAAFDDGSWEAAAATDRVAIVTLDLVCPSSFWSGAERSWTLRPNVAADFFPILPASVITATGLGAPSLVTVGGDVPAWPTVTWSGPGSALEFETPRGTWRVDLDTPITGGEVVTIRTDPRSQHEGLLAVEGPSGESFWQYLTQRQFRPLAPGEDTITVTVDDASASTSVVVSWAPQWRDVP